MFIWSVCVCLDLNCIQNELTVTPMRSKKDEVTYLRILCNDILKSKTIPRQPGWSHSRLSCV